MNALLHNFKETLLNPFASKSEEERLDYFEILGISWALHFVYAFYSIFAVYVGVKTYQYMNHNDSVVKVITSNLNLSLQKFSIIMGISEAIFYPVVFHFSYKFWQFILNFYGQVFNVEVDVEKESVDILNAIFASNIFLILPIGGKMLSVFAQGFYLFKGLMKKLGFTNLQAFLVLLTPLFIMFLFGILVVSYFFFLFSLI